MRGIEGVSAFFLKAGEMEDESKENESWQAGFTLNPASGTMMPHSQKLASRREKKKGGKMAGE